MSESGSVIGATVSGYVRQVGRGLIYLIILQSSIGIGVRMTFVQAVGSTPILRAGTVSTIVVAVVAAILVNSTNPPSYRRLIGFSLVSLVVGFTVDALVALEDGHIGALYPTLQIVLIWMGAFLIGYAVAFEVDWERAAGPIRKRDSP